MFLLFLVDLFCPGLPGGLIIYQFLVVLVVVVLFLLFLVDLPGGLIICQFFVVLVVVVFVLVGFGCFVLPWFTSGFSSSTSFWLFWLSLFLFCCFWLICFALVYLVV